MLETVKKQSNILSFSLIKKGTVIVLGLWLNECRRFNEKEGYVLLQITKGIEKKLCEEKFTVM